MRNHIPGPHFRGPPISIKYTDADTVAMAKLTPVLVDLIRRPDTNKVMSTISEDGMPHTIVCGTLTVPEEDVIAVGRVWLNRTGRNIQRDPRAEF